MKLFLIQAKEPTPEVTNKFLVRASTAYEARVMVARNLCNNDWYSPDFATCEQVMSAGEKMIIIRGF